MKISIVTVVYNNKDTIESAINSVLSQTYLNKEYIIIDGNSSDGTLEMVNKYRDKIDVVISEPDNGIYDAMNKGIKLASGEVIGILNSDDIYDNDAVINEIAEKFIANPNLKIVYGDLVYVASNDKNRVVRKWKSRPYTENFFKFGNVPPHPALFVKREVYEICGFFDVKYQLAADYDFMLRIFSKFGKASLYFPKLIVRMRLGGATNKSFNNILIGNKEILDSWKKNGLKVPFLLMPLRVIKRVIQFIK